MSNDTRYYIAGPMTGVPQFNIPAFDELAAKLRARGLNVVSPAELDDEETKAALLASKEGKPPYPGGQTWADFLARDVKVIADEVDAIIALKNWHYSKGARLEVFVGLLSKKPILHADSRAKLWRIEPQHVLYAIVQGFIKEWINAKLH